MCHMLSVRCSDFNRSKLLFCAIITLDHDKIRQIDRRYVPVALCVINHKENYRHDYKYKLDYYIVEYDLQHYINVAKRSIGLHWNRFK